ncbi:beta-lactamase domain protein (plasmid) [Calothrix parasitica NIES-267]|uniref:Beta-lactamase domain protein n=1 Tax=Calothrix parasitica NIES-267 TaxID=1973488 RepID=A0A1Z4M357_9CYAN|nr:beta-lactamase domain protein [Calothrix parasitica NIES-267]
MYMEFRIFDVGHGFCAIAVASNSNIILFDCGHKTYPEYRPSNFLPELGFKGIECLVVTNYDEDHISDFPNLQRVLPIEFLVHNTSISPQQLKNLKKQGGPLSYAMQNLLDMMQNCTQGSGYQPLLPGIEWKWYWNSYGYEFEDTNNISVVNFVNNGYEKFLIPGDLEVKGWQGLLRDPNFCKELKDVTVFIASHHGRKKGDSRDTCKMGHVAKFC